MYTVYGQFCIFSCVHNVVCCVSTVHALHDELVKCRKNKRVYNDKEWPISKERPLLLPRTAINRCSFKRICSSLTLHACTCMHVHARWLNVLFARLHAKRMRAAHSALSEQLAFNQTCSRQSVTSARTSSPVT